MPNVLDTPVRKSEPPQSPAAPQPPVAQRSHRHAGKIFEVISPLEGKSGKGASMFGRWKKGECFSFDQYAHEYANETHHVTARLADGSFKVEKYTAQDGYADSLIDRALLLGAIIVTDRVAGESPASDGTPDRVMQSAREIVEGRRRMTADAQSVPMPVEGTVNRQAIPVPRH